MNRKSLFGRLADSKTAAERQKYFRVSLEPLEDRKLLTTLHVSHNWSILVDSDLSGTLTNGDILQDGGITGVYGTDAFGTLTDNSFVAGSEYIADAINAAPATDDVVQIQPGTYVESDIVVTQGVVLTGSSSINKPVIVPQVASANASGDFPSGSHSGIIVYSANVTIRNLIIDGSGNSMNHDFHHGITTLYDTPGGGTVHNGTLTLKTLGVQGEGGTNSNVPDLLIENVEVKNTYWHGITISNVQNMSFDAGAGNNENLTLRNSTVTDVGLTKDDNAVGILVQNIGDQTTGTINLLISSTPNVYFNTISNVGVGVRHTYFGSLNFNTQNGATNRAAIITNTVLEASVYGIDAHGASNQFVVGNIATNTGTNTATGYNMVNSDQVFSGLYVTGFHIGLHTQDAWPADAGRGSRYAAAALATNITGPGTGDSGSVGILIDNQSDTTKSTTALLGAVQVTGFETGLKIEQVGASDATDGLLNRAWSFGAFFYGNGTDVYVGHNGKLEGGWSTVNNPGSVIAVDNGIINPRVFNYERNSDAIYYTNPTNAGTPVLAPDHADQFIAGSFSLGSSSTYDVTITGSTATGTYDDFSTTASYPGQFGPYIKLDPPYNQGLRPDTHDFVIVGGTFQQPAALNGWGSGNVTQNSGGNGLLQIGGTATGGGGLDALYNLRGHVDPNNASLYLLDPVDLTPYTYIDLDLKIDAGNQTKALTFSLIDRRGNNVLWPFPLETPPLSTSSFTTFHINLVTPSIPLLGPESDHLDLSNIAGFMIFGENGFLDLNGGDNLVRLSVDNIGLTSRENSLLESSGSIDLGGATLTGAIRSGFTAAPGQQFTIVNNTGGGAITGTFAGATEGSTVTIDGQSFTISYTGGTGNDVVLTATSYSSTVTGRRLFYNNSIWDNPGYLFTNATAIATDKSAYIPSGGNTTSYSNISNFTKGINGLMVELTGTHGTITPSDFSVWMSPQNSFVPINNVASWSAAPSFTVTEVSIGPTTDRYELIWADGAITNRYVYVRTEGNDAAGGNNTNTGLAASDGFFYGNFIGDVGSPEFYPNVDNTDQVQVRNNGGQPAFQTNIFDFNRDAIVDPTDEIIARNNQGAMVWLGPTLTYPTGPLPGPLPPPPAADGDDGSGSAVASALAASGSSGDATPAWVAARLESAASDGGPAADLIAQLMEGSSPQGGGSDGADAGDDADDALLGSLLDDLG